MPRIIAFSFFIGFILTFLQTAPAHAAGIEGIPERIDGKDRFEVAVNISKKWDHADYAVVTNYIAFADALTAAPFAAKYNAPILLSRPTALTAVTQEEIKRLGVKKVFVIGGAGSISDQVVEALKANGTREVERIGGRDRFEVAVNIAKKLDVKDKVMLANGFVFPDALAIAPYASANGIPILLTHNTTLPENIHQFIHQYSIAKTWVIGGEGSVSQEILAQMPSPSRIGGKDRYEVAANVVKTFGQNSSKFFLSTGMSFADALTGSILAAKENGYILLTNKQELPEPTQQLLKLYNRQVTILGGTGSVGEKIVSTIMDMHPSERPIIYFVPHQDDEILSMGIDIRNELSHGRNVQVVLMTDGENSGARDILNGGYDLESSFPSLTGEKIWCNWHQTYHDPASEHYRHDHLSFDEFANLRTDEFYRALHSLGVTNDHIHIESLHEGSINIDHVEQLVQKYLTMYPNADVRSLSWFDGHPTHSLIGQTIESMQEEGLLQRYQAKFLVSVYTDRFYNEETPIETQVEVLNKETDLPILLAAANEYIRFEPEKGFYGIGYHSVSDQFDAMMSETYSKFHY
ncbi:cell wall-binding repeat-containing protein [Neobacillus pocheonensis]|uniref:cell wall-binding repeat-containing protein n=1 Tax=Neobacillus pocheonensis TaxID=363869 RepID=UPI003D2AC88A